MKSQFVFVILHYCTEDITKRTVENICRYINGKPFSIVVVDNASPDGSGKRIRSFYQMNRQVHVIQNVKNEGYARGNNLGYRFAKENLDPQFIIILNSDIQILQNDFLERIQEIYRKRPFEIMGPDIITLDGKHQNPHRANNLTLKDLNRIIRNRTIILLYLKLKKILNIENRIRFIEKWDKYREKREGINIDTQNVQEDVVLHGSCLIFAPGYISLEHNAFYPKTFMWMEEEILTYLCEKKQYRILYDPSVWVLHEEKSTTKKIIPLSCQYAFYSAEIRKSARIMKELMKQDGR